MADKESIVATIRDLYASGYKDYVISALEGADEAKDEMIYQIGVDIYKSCIEDYYAQYTPTTYDRHGYIEGRNLYRAADDFANNDYEIAVGNEELDAGNLWKYKGKRGSQKRYQVLKSVINGLRGNKAVNGFPIDFITSYPNQYSTMHNWQSSKHTIYDIFDEFENKISKDMSYVYWDYLEQNL